MNDYIKPFCINHPWELAELVSDAIGQILKGAVLIDAALGNEEFGYFDLVAVNEDGEGVLFFLNKSGEESEYLQFLKCLRWYQDNRIVIQRLYSGRVSLGSIPLVIVVAPSFSQSIRKVLLSISSARVSLLKYACFEDMNNKRLLCLEQESGTDNLGKQESPHVQLIRSSSRNAELVTEANIDLSRFRREIGTDISDVSDEELMDLL